MFRLHSRRRPMQYRWSRMRPRRILCKRTACPPEVHAPCQRPREATAPCLSLVTFARAKVTQPAVRNSLPLRHDHLCKPFAVEPTSSPAQPLRLLVRVCCFQCAPGRDHNDTTLIAIMHNPVRVR